MSTATKKKSMKGVRYTDAQKKEVTDFAHKYNQDNGRGGQSKAAEKFNVSPLTVATWMKAADAPAPSKAAASNSGSEGSETAKAVAMPAKTPGKSRAGSRYTPEQKKQVTDFVSDYNAANGRGGVTQAIKKYGVAALTVAGWMKAAGVNGKVNKVKATKAAKGAKKAAAAATTSTRAASSTTDADMSGKLAELLDVSKQIATAEAALSKLQSRFASLKQSL